MSDMLFSEKILNSNALVFLIVAGILLLATELGFRFGRKTPPERQKQFQSQCSAIQAALLGLLGLLLGFTFAMAVNRFEIRKQLVLDEANSIGTAWLRAGYLDKQARDVIRPALLDYIEARLAGVHLAVNSQSYSEQLARSERDQAVLWRATVEEIALRDTPSTALFTAALNELIDLDGKRQAAGRNHVPATVWVLLLSVSFAACWSTGYTTALGGAQRHVLPIVILPAVIALVVTVLTDLDNPQRGLIQVSQQSLIDLQKTLQKYQ